MQKKRNIEYLRLDCEVDSKVRFRQKFQSSETFVSGLRLTQELKHHGGNLERLKSEIE